MVSEFNITSVSLWAGTVCAQVPATLCACCVAGTNCLTSLCSEVRMPTHGLLMRIRTCACKTLMQCLAQGRHWVSVGSHSYYHMSQSLSIKGVLWAAPQAQMVPTRGAFPVKMGSQLYMHPTLSCQHSLNASTAHHQHQSWNPFLGQALWFFTMDTQWMSNESKMHTQLGFFQLTVSRQIFLDLLSRVKSWALENWLNDLIGITQQKESKYGPQCPVSKTEKWEVK